MNLSTTAQSTIVQIEQYLANYYGFDLLTSAAEHSMYRADLLSIITPAERENSVAKARAGVWFSSPTFAKDELFIAIHFDETLIAVLESADPFNKLTNANLDAFCIAVEEISHFHFILNRANYGLHLSELELECQGEIDKCLVAATVLEEQSGSAHLLPLIRMLYDTSLILSERHKLYEEANRLAARFWFQVERGFDSPTDQSLQEVLRRYYRLGWYGKHQTLQSPSLSVAS